MENKYLQFTAEELALDPNFIDFVQKKSTTQLKWIQWIQKNPAMQSRIDEASNLVKSISFTDPKLSIQKKERIWSRIDAATSETKSSRSKMFTIYRMVAAACVLLLFGLFLLKPNISEYENLESTVMNIELPDQSDVTLSEYSVIRFNEKKFHKKRSLTLIGEAYFEVEKGSSFIVETDQGSVEVLGTGFKVVATNNTFEVTCDHGKVKVNSPGFESVILEKGESVYLDKQKGLLRNIKLPASRNLFSFRNASLRKVMDEIEDHYDITVTMEKELEETALSGTFVKSQVDSALQAICWPLQLKFTKISEQTFQITR